MKKENNIREIFERENASNTPTDQQRGHSIVYIYLIFKYIYCWKLLEMALELPVFCWKLLEDFINVESAHNGKPPNVCCWKILKTFQQEIHCLRLCILATYNPRVGTLERWKQNEPF